MSAENDARIKLTEDTMRILKDGMPDKHLWIDEEFVVAPSDDIEWKGISGLGVYGIQDGYLEINRQGVIRHRISGWRLVSVFDITFNCWVTPYHTGSDVVNLHGREIAAKLWPDA